MTEITKCTKCDSLTILSNGLCTRHMDEHMKEIGRTVETMREEMRTLQYRRVPMTYGVLMPAHIDTETHVLVPADLRTLDAVLPQFRGILRARMEQMMYGLAIVEIPDQAGILKHNDTGLKTMGALVPKDLYWALRNEPVPGHAMRVPIRD